MWPQQPLCPCLHFAGTIKPTTNHLRENCQHSIAPAPVLATVRGQFTEGTPGHFAVLQTVDVQGKGASRWFATMSTGCASTLKKLRIKDRSDFVEVAPGRFTVLRKLTVQGVGASRWFAAIAGRCALTLEDVSLSCYSEELATEVPGDFRVLRKVDVHGRGASRWFEAISMRCASTLEEVCIWEVSIR
eukprot:GHVU01033096.1.p1 GENE.GHVU01033096.1~~GHVU01033096.1.p1  ORF type:complete len:188 (+),score=17.46 GHVU01033096.1:59-622(+)